MIETDQDHVRLLVIAEARRWIGTPYRHQGSTHGAGCDCLGLVRGIWRQIYENEPEAMPAYSRDWAEAAGKETLLDAAARHMQPVAPDAMMPGDLLLFRWRRHLPAKHVGILVAEDRLCHAYEAAGGVCEGTLAPAWRKRIAAVYAFPAILREVA